ncbi:MAG: NAD(P)H-hydrate dehydratase [Armatimonadetes bacterium]|nr:NAD(P)H-hydrate dehydratase [Armatimonadota bacterium]
MKVATAAQMREMDRRTIEEYHVPSIVLMENAALRVVEAMQERFGPLEGKRVAVVCGKGNNGGDGLAIARHLASRFAARVSVWLAASRENLQGDAAVNLRMAEAFGLKVREIHPRLKSDFAEAAVIVDALLGTGITGGVTGEFGSIIEWMNDSGQPIVAVDVPSGLDADTGKVLGACVRATLTVTFALPKYGLLDFPGAEYAGEVIVGDIAMPRAVMEAPDITVHTTKPADVARWLPARVNGRDSNKGQFGHVMVFAGSGGFVGAPVMVAEAAARTGAGLVTLAIPSGIHQAAMARVSPVVMTRGLPQSGEGTFGNDALDPALKLTEKATAVALGPGLGHGDEAAAFVREFVSRCPAPLVIDADALTLLSQQPDRGASLVKNRAAPSILTPHPGEMGRLLGTDTKTVQADRRAAVTQAAETYGCVALLKGARTLIAAPDGTLYLNTTSNPGMATGGAGDVLTGVLSALLAQHLGPLEAAAAGAYIHGLAGDLTAAAHGGATGLIATDLLDHLPPAIARCQGGAQG